MLSTKVSSIRSHVSSAVSAASGVVQGHLNPTPSRASADVAGISGSGVFMSIVAGLLAVIV